MQPFKAIHRTTIRLWCASLISLLLAACGAAPLSPTAAPEPLATATRAPAPTAPTALPTTAATPVPAPTQPSATDVPPAPAINCTAPAALTPAQTEGPYYTPDTPERSNLLETPTPDTQLIVTGYVLTPDCQPIAGAWLDFWQADDEGAYDNAGYNFRGHQTTDATGRYELATVLPGLYPGRTRHIHVKVQAPNGPILTTQVYFPDEPANIRDGIFDPALIVDLQTTPTGDVATFNFVINAK